MNIASDLLPNFLFCSAGFLPLPDVHGTGGDRNIRIPIEFRAECLSKYLLLQQLFFFGFLYLYE